MNILDRIVAHKQQETQARQKYRPVAYLEQSPLFSRPCIALDAAVCAASGVIAEHKRRSPSRLFPRSDFPVTEIVRGYQDAAAAAVSVLTDVHFFGGCTDDVLQARAALNIPILRKDFTLETYHILEAKAMGADAVLLIAAILDPATIRELAAFATSLGMQVLLEVHNLQELERSLCPEVQLVGVNNRNLQDFTTSLQRSLELIEAIPREFVRISESGIDTPAQMQTLQKAGFDGFLIGGQFMQQPHPGQALAAFLQNQGL